MKDMYKHLDGKLDKDIVERCCDNYSQNLNIELNMDEVAQIVCRSNYGLHRFLSSTINYLRENGKNALADKLEESLEYY
jgi:hypothetical protein